MKNQICDFCGVSVEKREFDTWIYQQDHKMNITELILALLSNQGDQRSRLQIVKDACKKLNLDPNKTSVPELIQALKKMEESNG